MEIVSTIQWVKPRVIVSDGWRFILVEPWTELRIVSTFVRLQVINNLLMLRLIQMDVGVETRLQ